MGIPYWLCSHGNLVSHSYRFRVYQYNTMFNIQYCDEQNLGKKGFINIVTI